MNLTGKESALKHNSTDTLKVWWIPVLARGRLHLDVIPHDFPGECPEAAEAFVDKVAAIVNVRFPNEAKPRVVMSGRGGATPLVARSISRFGPGLQHNGTWGSRWTRAS